VLTIASSLIVEGRKADHELRRDQAARQAAREEQAAAEQRTSLKALSESYERLGDTARRATEYAETGKAGSPEDVRATFRHFTRAMRMTETDPASFSKIARYYGEGPLRGWATRFMSLASGNSPSS
jgi:hypothetical protein